MKSTWTDADSSEIEGDDLALCAYASRLLGADDYFLSIDGVTTSAKVTAHDLFGREVEVLHVKSANVWSESVQNEDFDALRLNETKLLADVESLTDDELAEQLSLQSVSSTLNCPSLYAPVHAAILAKFVIQSHADFVIALLNNAKADALIAELYPDCLVVPYKTPGVQLCRHLSQQLQGQDIDKYAGIIVKQHGLITYSNDCQSAYEIHCELVGRAKKYVDDNCSNPIPVPGDAAELKTGKRPELLRLATIRKAISNAKGAAQLVQLDSTPAAIAYASRGDIDKVSAKGPMIVDHVARTRRIPAVLEFRETGAGDDAKETLVGLEEYSSEYQAGLEKHLNDSSGKIDTAPRVAIWKNNGVLAVGNSVRDRAEVAEIARHTSWCMQTAEAIGGWSPLPSEETLAFEACVKDATCSERLDRESKPHLGKVAIVTGACGGIGRATAERLHSDGAVVIGLDINPKITENLDSEGLIGRVCDLTNEEAVQQAVEDVVFEFGGLDIVVLNAGIFKSGETIDQLDETWDRTMAINLTASQRFLKHTIPYLKLGVDASIIVIGSRNYPAPGAGAAAYSVSKAGITQLARVAALELCKSNVRVNIIHPDAVFDTELWTQEALEKSAKRYNMTVEQYKTKNLLGREVRSSDVGRLVSVVASDVFCATTGAQIPIDGGSDRVI